MLIGQTITAWRGTFEGFEVDTAAFQLDMQLDNYRCSHTRVIYGDQAMFVRRTLFHHLGGFPNQPILEDVAFCEKLHAVTDPVPLDDYVLTDPRKFVKMGIWRSSARIIGTLVRLELGQPVSATHPFFQDVR